MKNREIYLLENILVTKNKNNNFNNNNEKYLKMFIINGMFDSPT